MGRPRRRTRTAPRGGWSSHRSVRTELDVAAGDRLSAIWHLALASGLRRGELLGLTWDDADQPSVHVRRQVLLRPRAVQGTRRVFVRSTLKNRRAPCPAGRADRRRAPREEGRPVRRASGVRPGVEGRRWSRRAGRLDRDGGGRNRGPPGHAARALETAGEGSRRPSHPAARRAALLRVARALERRSSRRREPHPWPFIQRVRGGPIQPGQRRGGGRGGGSDRCRRTHIARGKYRGNAKGPDAPAPCVCAGRSCRGDGI